MRSARHVPLVTLLAGATLVALGACAGTSTADGRGTPPPSGASSSPTAAPSSPTSGSSSTSSPTPSTTSADDRAAKALAGMSLAQRVGQLLMVGTPAAGDGSSAGAAIARYHVGNVILTGRSSRGVASTAATTRALQRRATRAATGSVPLLVATDQEGGQVQSLSGPGFSAIPSATTQGTWPAGRLQDEARRWGGQLHRAGVNVALGPVADTVPLALAADNPPIGQLDREFGHTAGAVTASVLAYDAGMREAGVSVSPKHFPGLGHVKANTDTTAGVRDTTTSATSPDVGPFAAAVRAGAPLVMVSSAVYTRIDPDHPACFSKAAVTDLLRRRLGFSGVVLSDDLGAAVAVQAWSAGSRAVQFIAAGGDVVLTIRASLAGPMAQALVHRALQSQAFRAQVDAAALRVLRAKADAGLLPR